MGNNASAPRAPLETLDAAGVHALLSSLGAASADVADKLRAIDVDGAYLFHISDADLEGTLDDLGVTPLQRRFLAAKLRGALGRPPPSSVVGRDREVSKAPPPPTGGLGPRTSRMHWGRTTARALHHREDLQRAEATSEAAREESANFPTSKAPLSAVSHSFRPIFGRAIISRNGRRFAEFRGRVRAAAVQLAAGGSPGRRAASARVADVLARVGRDAPGARRRGLGGAASPRGAVDVEALVDLVIVVEERRTAGILESGRRECAELLEVSGGEDFVRVVGEEDNAPCCGVKIFDPDHPLIENFELLIMFILIFVFVTLPLCLAFERVERQLSDANFVCDLIFCVDVLKNCNTGYADDTGAIVMDRRRVLKNYLRTWFFIDFVSSVPADRIMDAVAGGGGGGDVVGGKKVLKLLRLVRMTKLVKLLRASQLVKQAYDYPAESWAARWDIVEAETGSPVYGVLHCYSWGIYKTLLLVLNCAYADFPSAQVCFETSGWCTIESWMTLVGVFLGWFLNMIFISTITSILVSMDLRDRIRDYYDQRWKEGSIFDETLILERLSPELCHEIMRYKTRDLVKKVPALRNATTMFMKELVSSLQPSAAPEGDVVVHEGETGESLFFVDTGLAEILAKAVGDQVVKLIADGCFFGECSLVLKCRCTATVRAKTVLSCYAVGDEDLDEILEDHADMREYLAAARLGGADETALEDEEDAATPLFLSLAAKRRQKLLEGEHRGIRHSLVRAYGRASAVFAGGQPAVHRAKAELASPREQGRRREASEQARDGSQRPGKVTLPAIGEAASVRTLDDGVVQLE
ncbi:voltage-gated potassium channel [Aureococcus anophagefferens]|nr:voltage-gated potassium channel [Aureococcus anophagefferens]